ncbi:MAG: hypothetical protein EOM87_07785 [Clostridia bacterium]|nr:hypothetical protein [Clostridia bacterium]
MDKEHNTRDNLIEYANLALACIFSFAGCYFILPRSGVFATLMLIIPLAFACALLKLKWWIKVLFFAGFGYILSTIYIDSALQSVVTGLICGVLVALAMVSVWLFKKKKPVFIIAGAAIIAVTAVFHFAVMGNPFEAFRTDGMIKDHVEEQYDGNSVVLSSTYYDRNMGVFCADIYGKTDPTTIYTIYVFGDTLTDNYGKHIEYNLMTGKRLEMSDILRRAFPSAGFTIKQVSISGYPDGKMSLYDTTDYSKRMSFDIYVSSDLTVTEFKSRINAFLLTLCGADIGVEKLTFYGGKTGNYVRMVPYYVSAIPQTYRREAVADNLVEEYICRTAFPPISK